MRVTMIGSTDFFEGVASMRTGNVWNAEFTGAQDLSEFAGRACYQSWTKSNPATTTNRTYLAHILEVHHESVLEHGSVTFYVEDVSRSLTHELIRHRHLSYSQLSQRFVVLKPNAERKYGEGYVVPPLLRNDGIAAEILEAAWMDACDHYNALLERAEQLLDVPGMTGTEAKKRAREAARAVLPNMTPTALVVTGNHRAWREAIAKRARPEADAEICELFVEIYKQLIGEEQNLYQDMHITSVGGRTVVCSCKDNSGE